MTERDADEALEPEDPATEPDPATAPDQALEPDPSTEEGIEELEEAWEDVHERSDDVKRLVAILIMIVTLMGAGSAFLRTQAGDREARANRQAESYSVRTLSALVAAGRATGRREAASNLAGDLLAQSSAFAGTAGQGGPAAAYASELSRAYGQVSASVISEAKGVLGYGLASADFARFYVDQYRPAYEAVEYQKAYARERDGWGGKSGDYVTVITVFAVALFLLGLTLTVPPVARPPFLVVGTVVAIAAAGWGISIWLRSVETPPVRAIQAYAAGQAELDVIQIVPNATKADHDRIVADMTTALRVRPDFREALLARGSAYFDYDLAVRPDGPHGSPQARDDWAAAVRLDPTDAIGWVDLGAAQFWLGDYRGSLASERKAVELRGNEPISRLDLALDLAVTHDDAGYRREMAQVRTVLIAIPSWLRDAVADRYGLVITRGLRYRPELAPFLTRLHDDLLGMVHQIDVSDQVNGSPNPPAVAAKVRTPTFSLSADRTVVTVAFTYTGMRANEPWLYRTYVNGGRNDNFSIGSQQFDPSRFTTPDGGIDLTFTDKAGFVAGEVLRVEIFVEGNLLGFAEYTVP